jgi:enolase
MFTILNGGKLTGSKVKFATFYLIIDVQGTDKVDALEVYYKVTGNIKRLIAAHKLGEAGFKVNAQGSYYNAFDTINDSFKLLEDAINQA